MVPYYERPMMACEIANKLRVHYFECTFNGHVMQLLLNTYSELASFFNFSLYAIYFVSCAKKSTLHKKQANIATFG